MPTPNQLSELQSSDFAGSESRWFRKQGVGIKHNDSAMGYSFKKQRFASLLLLDGIGLVIEGAVTNTSHSMQNYDNGELFYTTTSCRIDTTIQSQTCTLPSYQVVGAGPTFMITLRRTEEQTLYAAHLKAKSKFSTYDGLADPSLFALVLTEALSEVMLRREKAALVHKGLTEAWRAFLRIYDEGKSVQTMKSSAILLADWAYIAIGYHRDEELKLKKQSSRLWICSRQLPPPAWKKLATMQACPDISGYLLDRYFIRGVSEMGATRSAVPRAAEPLLF